MTVGVDRIAWQRAELERGLDRLLDRVARRGLAGFEITRSELAAIDRRLNELDALALVEREMDAIASEGS